jgi:DNA-binding NarL/FixJ family response regulator
MERLSPKDMDALLSTILILSNEIDPETMPQRTVMAVESLIPGEFVAFDGFGADNKFTVAEWYSDYEIASPQNAAIFADCFNANPHEHPLALEVVEKKRQSAVKISDFVNQTQFHRTTLYHEFFRRVGFNYQMAVALPISQHLTITCGVDRVSADFSERERAMITLLAPHLLAAICNSQKFGKLREEQILLQTAIEASSQSVIILNTDGQIKFMTTAATKLLDKYFAENKSEAGFLPEDLRQYAKHHQVLFEEEKEFFLPPRPFIVQREAGELQIRATFDNQMQEIVLLLQEQENLSVSKLFQLGLTKRETEILFLIMQGKTNIEIGILCRISWRTAQKHVEHIYQKLGVETRTAAMLRAIEILQGNQ